MATAADIDRLKALVGRLLPLSARARGEVIAAEDWNTVVGALLEVARAVVADGPDTAVPPHEHRDQVGQGWLDPKLRDLVQRGPLADPTATARLDTAERRAALSLAQLDQMSAQVRDLRTVAARQETNDLDRASSLSSLNRRVEGLTDPRDAVGTLRASLDAIGANVSAVSAFAAGLGDLTPAALRDGLARVDQLQQRLTTPTGALLDVADIERRMAVLSSTLVTQDQLNSALRDFHVELPDNVRTELLDQAKAAAQQQAQASAGALIEQARAEFNGRIADLQGSLVQAARDAAAQFRDDVQAAVTAQLAEVIRQGDAAVRDGAAQALSDAATTLRSAIDDRVTQLEGTIPDRVNAAITQAQPALIDALGATITDRLAAVTGQLRAVQDGLGQVRASLNQTATDLATLRQSTATTLDQQVSALRADTAAQLAGVAADLRAAQGAAVDGLRADLAAERSRVDDALTAVRQSIPPVIRGVSAEELNAALTANNDRLRTGIITALNTRIDDRLRGRVNPVIEVPPRLGGPVPGPPDNG